MRIVWKINTLYMSVPNFYSRDLKWSHLSLVQAGEHTNHPLNSFIISPVKSSKEFLHSEAGMVYWLKAVSGICIPESPFTSCVTPSPILRSSSVKWGWWEKNMTHLRGLSWGFNQSIHENTQYSAWNIVHVQKMLVITILPIGDTFQIFRTQRIIKL